VIAVGDADVSAHFPTQIGTTTLTTTAKTRSSSTLRQDHPCWNRRMLRLLPVQMAPPLHSWFGGSWYAERDK
jgi:hypothetical protein